jgi:membrane protease YdiL (CAAX protease family)
MPLGIARPFGGDSMANDGGASGEAAQQPDAARTGRFTHFERPGDDFPFYNGLPVWITAPQWLLIMAAVVAGFLALIAPIPFFAGGIGQFIPAVLFFAIPLAALAFVTPAHWTAIFRKIRIRDIGWMVAFALLNLAITISIGLVVIKQFGTSGNPAVAGLAALPASETALFFLKTIPQLFGEEVLSILPFLALLSLFYTRMNFSRRSAVLCAWLIIALLFGAAHLPTYNWNFFQCIIVIGGARLVLMLPYIMTKNILVSTGTHILNDWALFYMAVFLPATKAL